MISITEALHEIIRLYEQRNLRDAEILCLRILEVEPDNSDANHFMGIIAFEVKNFPIARQYLEKAIKLNPDNPSIYLNMGNVIQSEGGFEESIQWYEKSIVCNDTDNKKAYNNMGVALTKLGRFTEAEECAKKAIKIDPSYFEAHNNIGEIYKDMGRFEDALAACEKALELAPQFVPARWNRAILLLLAGRLKEGFEEYEWRWKREQTPKRKIDAGEKWQGQSLQGKTIFIYEEQGLGDTMQFIRYLPMIKKLGGNVIFETVPSLIRLVEKAEGFDRLWVGQKNVDTRPVDRFDYYFPLMSLPGIFNTTIENIPNDCTYLKPDKELSKIWEKRFPDTEAFKIGIVWAGHPEHTNDYNRSVYLSSFSVFKEIPGVELYSLQKEKYEKWTDRDPVEIFHYDFGEEISDFADTAAIIENLDLVISIDTSVVHLAGAMGKSVWTLLPICPDWRWMTGRDDSPWYPSMKLFRQPAPGDWKSVFRAAAEELVLCLKEKNK